MKRLIVYQHDDGTRIEFAPVKRMPGFTHRVIIGGKAVDWLSDTHKPNATTAAFFYRKHKA